MRLTASSSDPYYQQIKDALRAKIVSGELKPGALIPDERSLAQKLKVSRKTTRRAILELTGEGLLRRVRGRGTYVRDSLTIAHARKNCIAVACGENPFDRGSPYYSAIIDGIYRSAAERGLFLIFEQIVKPYDQFLSSLRNHQTVKGVVLIGVTNEELSSQLLRLDMPLVLIDSHQPGDKPLFDLVTHDAAPGVCAAVKDLARLGHKQIGFMRSENLSTVMAARMNGYLRGMAEEGLPVRNAFIYKVRYSAEAAYAATKTLLAQPETPTAIVCAGDDQALGVMAAVNDFGWRVPRDISVVGFGDIGYFTSPSLSTVRVPKQQMGAMAVQMLELRLAHPMAAPKHMALTVEWRRVRQRAFRA
jgi:DNA-binding LacI/PurR family transcriptional regulator